MLRRIVTNKFFIPLVLVAITFITYLNILPNKLFFDDEELIYKNTYITDLKFLPRYFTQNMIAGAGKVSNMYRPVLTLSFAVDYLLWGNNPFGYHLTSIILHAANSILVFFLIWKLFKNKLLAFFASFFFIVHPVQSEAVIYASGRTDPLVSLFGLITLVLSLSFLDSRKFKILKYIGSIFFFALAVLSKETAVMFPFIILLVYFIADRKKRFNFMQLFVLIIPYLLLDIIYVYMRLTVLNFADTLNFYPLANPYSSHLPIRLFTFTSVFFQYLGTLFFPKDLVIARNTAIITSFTDLRVIFFVAFFIGCLIFSLRFWNRNKLFFFAFAWFFITIIPVSGVIPINNIIAEHYLYFPSIAFFLLISYIITQLMKKFQTVESKSFFIMVIMFLIFLLFIKTTVRTFDWRDPITFYSISLKQSPWNIPMQNNLAMAYAEGGQLELAISQYKAIIAGNDVYPNTHHNLGNVYKQLGRYKEAEQEYQKALEIDPKFIFSYYALADLYEKTGEKEKFKAVLEKIK